MRTLYTLTVTLTVLAALGSVSSSRACIWCTDKPITIMSYVQEQARHRAEKSALLSEENLQRERVGKHYKVPSHLQKHVIAPQFVNEPTHRFYTEYLCEYYPQAPVICDVLAPSMCPDALANALHSLVYFISSGNWRYFVNSENMLVLEQVHVKILLEQLGMIIKMLKRASISPTTGLIELAEPGSLAPAQSSVMQYWRKHGSKMVDDLHALYLDFIVRLAYINILYQDYPNSYSYYERLQRELKLVVGTQYEQTYTQVSRLYVELLKMLRQRLWGSDSGSQPISTATSTALERWAQNCKGMDELQAFAHSFVTHYECNVTGKFTHEYHPFLLDKTGNSLVALEERLGKEDLPIIGRLMLMGYEEQGVPRYYTDYADAYFTDEMAAKTQAGWSLKMFNRFGLLTGFLCKHANQLSAYAAKHKGIDLPLTHINPELVEIFDGMGTLFQEHAFGDAYWPVLQTINRVEGHLSRMAMPQLCRELMHFWQTLYNNELKVTGKQHVVGTQDILFSIAYMRHLQSSNVPIMHFYMGPDITYPIETSSLHKKEVTRHAQSFVKKFVPQLKAHNGKKTGYIFCSFVDGVGKSTMLGNVQNWMNHGDNIDKYEHVDNSSSQLATVFDFSDEAVIADLPAQVSHFTYKPDGYVYVDIGATDMTMQQREDIQSYVSAQQHTLIEKHQQLMRKTHAHLVKEGYDVVAYEKENPEISYCANVILLDVHDSPWVSFAHDGNYYLFDSGNPRAIRIRGPLGTAPSHGLKNTCTEQMIFSAGVRFPLSYKNFVQDLIDQMHDHGVEQVVMVDFLSMYSRSSRENIRVNYIIQQLALLYKDFSVGTSFYQNFVHNAQLLSFFEEPGCVKAFHRTLSYETVVRTALYDLLREHADNSIEAIDLTTITGMLREKIKVLPTSLTADISSLVDRKLKGEHLSLQEAYGNTREFVAIQQFRATDLVAFTRKLSSIYTKKVQNDDLNELWEKVRDARHLVSKTIYHHGGTEQQFAELDNYLSVRIIGRIPANCKDRQILLPLIRQIRAGWYATLSNLLYTHDNGTYLEMQQKFNVPPIFAINDDEGNVCIVHTVFESVDKEYEMPEYSLFEITPREEVEDWGVFEDKLYLNNWEPVENTHGGVYGFGHEAREGEKKQEGYAKPVRPIVSVLYEKFAKDFGDERVLLHEKLFEELTEKIESIRNNRKEWKKEADRHGEYKDDLPAPKRQDKDASGKVKPENDVQRHYLRDDQIAGVRLFMRGIATLDMIAKDPEVDLASRRGNREDFRANLRIAEWLTLPWLYGLLPKEPLFDNYEDVEPLMAWDFFDK